MSETGEFDPGQRPYNSVIEVRQAAAELATRTALYADWLGEASEQARQEVNPNLNDTELADDWPVDAFKLKIAFDAFISSGLKHGQPGEWYYNSYVLESGFAYADTLERAYPDTTTPGLSFTIDLINWAEKMCEKGRRLMLLIDLGDEEASGVDYSVFEEADAVGRHFEDLTAMAMETDPDEIAMHTWVGGRTVVNGTPDRLASLNALINPNPEE